MNMLKHGASACVLATLAMIGADAAAATIRVTCEARGTRAKISVDGRGLAAGAYTAVVVSGANMATSPAENAVAGEIETDFDSNPADIRAGAVAVVPGFIVGGQVSGKIVNAAGNTVIADTASCRVRSR
jgi:hypothetical protein